MNRDSEPEVDTKHYTVPTVPKRRLSRKRPNDLGHIVEDTFTVWSTRATLLCTFPGKIRALDACDHVHTTELGCRFPFRFFAECCQITGERLCWGVISSECSFLSSHHVLCLQHVELLFGEGIRWGGEVTYRIVLSSKRRALFPSLASRDAGSLDSQDVDSSGILYGILRDP